MASARDDPIDGDWIAKSRGEALLPIAADASPVAGIVR
jgi:hypothetical protein